MTAEHDVCYCDHLREDHARSKDACLVDDCPCMLFEPLDDDEWDGDEDREPVE